MLSGGALADIHAGEQVTEPVVQVLGIRKIVSETRERYRLAISDGVNFGHAMLATKMNQMLGDSEVVRFSIIKLVSFMQNTVQGKKIIIISDAEVVQKDYHQKIGNPGSVTDGTAAPSAAEPAAPAPASEGVDVKPNIAQPNVQQNPYASAGANPYSNPYRSDNAGAGNAGAASASTNSADSQPFVPIVGLNPYGQKWTIKGRISKKLDVKEFKNGKGKLFSFHFQDTSAEMKCIAFTDYVEEYFPLIEKGGLYTISGGDLKAKNSTYNKLSGAYELIINKQTKIERVFDEGTTDIPKTIYRFTEIEKLGDIQFETAGQCDLIAVVKSTEPLAEITTKAGKPMVKRDLNLVDQNAGIRCTLWGEQASSFPDDGEPVIIAIKDARLSDFNGRSLSVGFNSEMELNPDIPEAHALLGWYKSGGAGTQVKMMTTSGGVSRDPYTSERKPLSAIGDENLGTNDKPDYFTTKAIVHAVRKDKDICYKSCPSEGKCQKKLTEDGGMYRCESCNETFGRYNWRMLTSVSITDHTDTLWVTLFEDSVEAMIGKSAAFMGDLQEQEDKEGIQSIMDEIVMKEFIFTVRVKNEVYQDTPSIRAQAIRIHALDYAKEGRRILSEIP